MASKPAAKKTSTKKKATGATPAPAATPKSAPGWVWMITGLLAGLFIAFLFFLNQQPQQHPSTPVTESKPTTPKSSVKPPKDTQGNSELEFYKILPKLQVEVPEKEQTEKKPEKVEKPGLYVLQVGSFRRYEDADKQKAKLAFLGIESHIQKATDKKGGTWHRVRVGPYKDLERLNDIRVILHKNAIETLLMKVEG